MGQETKRLKLLLLLVKDQVATPGIGCVLAATVVLGEGAAVSSEG